jgi:hypothetical protein
MRSGPVEAQGKPEGAPGPFPGGPAPAAEEEEPNGSEHPPEHPGENEPFQYLEEDVKSVIAHLEESGDGIWDEERECIAGSRRIGAVTVWVSYRKIGRSYEVQNVYSPRICVQEETGE